MQSFKDFSKYKRTPEGHIIIDEPIHFKNLGYKVKKTKEGYVIIDEPIHFKGNSSNKLKEKVLPDSHSRLDNANSNHYIVRNSPHDNHSRLSEKLHNATAKDIPEHDQQKIIDGYISDSGPLNRSLIHGHDLTKDEHHHEEAHKAILKHAKPSGHSFHVMSGTKADLGELAKHSKDGVLHSSAHISTTHSQGVAERFSTYSSDKENKYHAVQVHVKPTDKVLHVSMIKNRLGENPHAPEHETIIPAGTKLKYSHTTHHDFGVFSNYDNRGQKVKVDHFTIHSQE